MRINCARNIPSVSLQVGAVGAAESTAESGEIDEIGQVQHFAQIKCERRHEVGGEEYEKFAEKCKLLGVMCSEVIN